MERRCDAVFHCFWQISFLRHESYEVDRVDKKWEVILPSPKWYRNNIKFNFSSSPEFPKESDPMLRDLIEIMLEKDPEKRPTVADLMVKGREGKMKKNKRIFSFRFTLGLLKAERARSRISTKGSSKFPRTRSTRLSRSWSWDLPCFCKWKWRRVSEIQGWEC